MAIMMDLRLFIIITVGESVRMLQVLVVMAAAVVANVIARLCALQDRSDSSGDVSCLRLRAN